jgi:catechol 2,3-dioxygenase-like lactoylglutathione lyase family enzyme
LLALELVRLIGRTLILLLALATAVATPAAAETVVRGLDHIPLAVRDLDASKADFEALGFVLKPGRPHANGLRNAHVKFPDGTEIELITAPAATDALTSEYHTWLKDGDGPAFLGLYAPDLGALIERISRLGLTLDRNGDLGTFSEPVALKRLFFANRQRSPTDRTEHFAHANTAFSLAGVWLAGAAAEQRLLPSLGAAPIEEPPCGPLGPSSAAFSLSEGEIVFLPATAQLAPGRSIIGATVAVKSIDTLRSILNGNRIRHARAADCARDSLWVGPVHGLWLEFRQLPASR